LLLLLAAVGWSLSERVRILRLFSIPAFLAVGNLAAMVAFLRFLRGTDQAVWEPTRREEVEVEGDREVGRERS
jgi:hypothetical protein